MIRRKLGKHNKIASILLAVCLVLWGSITAVQNHIEKKKALEPVLLETLVQESYFFSEELPFTQEAIFDSGLTEIRLVYGKNGGEVYETPEKVCYVEKEDRVINRKTPVYQKNGASLYFPADMAEYRLFYTDYTVSGGVGEVWFSYGSVYNAESKQAVKKSVLFADLGEGVFVNALPVTVEGIGTYTVPANSLIHLYEDNLGIFAFSDGVLYRYYIPVKGESMVKAEGVRISYHKLYQFCKDAVISDEPQVTNNGVLLEGDYFYFDMGERFEINGPGFLYETKEGWYFENETYSYFMPSAPLYETGTGSIYLPADYMMLQIYHRLYQCLPASTRISQGENVTLVSYQDVYQGYNHVLLHDGKNHYVVTEDALFRLNDTEITISAMSAIDISDEMEICFYQYDSEEYFTFYTGGKEPELVLQNGDVVYLYDRLIRRKDGTLDLLVNNPSVFPVIQ